MCLCVSVVCDFKWLIEGDHFENISEKRLKGSEGNIAYTSGKSIPSRGNGKCKAKLKELGQPSKT